MLIIFLGPPGSGKGTQASILAKEYGYKHISTGDLLRAESKSGSELGNLLNETMGKGHLVSDDIVNKIVAESLKRPEYKNVILDGYPRKLSQASYLDTEAVSELDDYVAINFKIDTQKLRERIEARYACAKCNHIYNKISHNPEVEGVCDICQSTEFIFRKDDNAESLITRVELYDQEIAQIKEFYKERAKLCAVDADLPVEEVTSQLRQCMKLGSL